MTPPPRVTINNNYFGGSPPVLGTGYDQDTRGVDLDAMPAKKQRPAEADPEPAPAKPLPGVFHRFEGTLHTWGYFAVAGFIFFEDFGIPLPGETMAERNNDSMQ